MRKVGETQVFAVFSQIVNLDILLYIWRESMAIHIFYLQLFFDKFHLVEGCLAEWHSSWSKHTVFIYVMTVLVQNLFHSSPMTKPHHPILKSWKVGEAQVFNSQFWCSYLHLRRKHGPSDFLNCFLHKYHLTEWCLAECCGSWSKLKVFHLFWDSFWKVL